MAEPVPAPLFFACSREAVDLMRQFGMTDMAIATALISVRAAAITEERQRLAWVSLNYPPHAGIRPQDILAEIASAHSNGEL
jgi:hypothetical protein